jgi:hypothetical protein
MISFMDTHPEFFEEAIELAIADKQPYSWRAAWLLWSCMEDNDQRIQKHIKAIMDAMISKKDNHQRELLKILLRMELMETMEGILYDQCVKIWQVIDKKPSVRLTAFKGIAKIAKNHPDLSHEMALLTHSPYLDGLSPVVIKAILEMKKEITRP